LKEDCQCRGRWCEAISQLFLMAGIRHGRDQIDFNNNLVTPNSGSKTFSRSNPRAGLTYMFSQPACICITVKDFAFPPFKSCLLLARSDRIPFKAGSIEKL
jgi:hypothetical protein